MKQMKPAGSFGRAPRKDIFDSVGDPNISIAKFRQGNDSQTFFGKEKRRNVQTFGQADRSLLPSPTSPSLLALYSRRKDQPQLHHTTTTGEDSFNTIKSTSPKQPFVPRVASLIKLNYSPVAGGSSSERDTVGDLLMTNLKG